MVGLPAELRRARERPRRLPNCRATGIVFQALTHRAGASEVRFLRS